MPGWVVSLIGLFGVILGAGISEFRHWMERKEKYQVMTFEKRLEAHQEAYYFCIEAGMLLNKFNTKEQEVGKRFVELSDEAMKWLNRNCLYLDTRSRKSVTNAFLAVSRYASAFTQQSESIDQAREYAHAELKKSLQFIAEGIGAKHLPETDKQLESRKGL